MYGLPKCLIRFPINLSNSFHWNYSLEKQSPQINCISYNFLYFGKIQKRSEKSMKTLIDEAITASMRGGKQVFFFWMAAAADAAASITARAGSCVASRLRHRKRTEDVVRFERIRIDLPSQKRASQNAYTSF